MAKNFIGCLARLAADLRSAVIHRFVVRPGSADWSIDARLGRLDGLHEQVFQRLPFLDQVPQTSAPASRAGPGWGRWSERRVGPLPSTGRPCGLRYSPDAPPLRRERSGRRPGRRRKSPSAWSIRLMPPRRITSPRSRMATRSQISSTSPSKCELRKMVVPRCLQVGHHLADLAPADRIDAVGRLVEEDHLGVVHQGLGDAEPLLHALGIGADLGVHPPLDADHFQHLGDALAPIRPGHLQKRAVEFEQAGAGVVVGKAVVLGQVADATANARPCRPARRAGRRCLRWR